MAHRKSIQEQRVACDQCHRRKVKCDESLPCEKCVSAGLQCTRQMVRKRRGPKKGSGSVIAQLRSSHGKGLDSNGSSLDLDSHSPSFAPYPDTLMDDALIPSPTSFSGSPTITFSGLIPSSQPWTHGGPPHTPQSGGDQFLTVNELAQRILRDEDFFFNPTLPTSSPGDLHNGNHLPSPPALNRYPPPTSIESLLTSTNTTTSQPFPTPYHHQRTNSGRNPPSFTTQVSFGPLAMAFPEDNTLNLAVALGMSANDGPIMSKSIDLYFQHLYPIMPVIHETAFRRLLVTPASLRPDEKCVTLALCAATIIQVSPGLSLEWDVRKELAQRLLQQFFQTRLSYDYAEASSLYTIISSFFLHSIYFEMKKFSSAWFYLREAVGMAVDTGLDDEEKYRSLNHQDLVAHRRTFALLFITERGSSILRNKPIMINKLRELPVGYFENEEPSILTGFQCLCQLFRLLDDKFVEYWNSPHDSGLQPRASGDISAVQAQLTSLEFAMAGIDDVQKADVLITQQWMRLVFWQAAMRQGLLSSTADDQAFTYRFPVDIARSLCDVLSRLPIEAVLVHGIGIFEKVFEVAYSLMDTLSLSKSSRSSSLEDLKFLFRCLSASPASHETYVKVLVNKYNSQQAIPNTSETEILQTSGAPWVTTTVTPPTTTSIARRHSNT